MKTTIEYGETPIELEEQAQLLEQKQRDLAITQLYRHYVTVPGIAAPADAVDCECEECGATIPAARIRALMVRVTTTTQPEIWKAHPSVVRCVSCAELYDNKQRQYNR